MDRLLRCSPPLDCLSKKKKIVYFFTQMKCVAMKAKRVKATGAPLLVVQK